MLTHVVITRLDYEDDSKIDSRIELYKSLTLPCLLEQTDQNFDIAVKCNPKHFEKVRQINERIIPFYITRKGKERIKRLYNYSKLYIDFIEWEYVRGLKKYNIQTSLDSDDIVEKNYIAKIKEEVGKHIKEYPGESLHIHFQPELVNIRTGETKKMNRRYSNKLGSMFYSLFQPGKKDYIFIGHDSHLKMMEYADRSVLIPEGYCKLSVHGDNDSTTMES
jgi:predicted DNA-binding protein (MmcQ/YjbR family)